MEERPDQTDANHDIDPWRVVIALAPLVAVAALAGGVTTEAGAEYQKAAEVLRAASWVATAVALVWCAGSAAATLMIAFAMVR